MDSGNTEQANPRELTYGEKAVGLTFNPSGDERVIKLKKAAADFIDLCQEVRTDSANLGTEGGEVARMASVAITEAQTAQMWAVKAATWQK